MPLTAKGEKILGRLEQEYGAEKGKQVLYAGKNKGTFTGIDAAVRALADGMVRLGARFDAMCARADARAKKDNLGIPANVSGMARKEEA